MIDPGKFFAGLRGGRHVLGINRRNIDLVFRDHRPGRFRILDDKLAAKKLLSENRIPTPRTLALIRGQGELSRLPELMADMDELVIKPARGFGGKGILLLERDPAGWRTPSGSRVSEEELAEHICDILGGLHSLDESEDVAILEERLHPHPFLSEIYGDGLADIRIILQKGKVLQAMLRVPSAESEGKANLHGGGLGIGIDIETGVTCAAVHGSESVERHPDSGAQLIGLRIPTWKECIEIAKQAAAAVDIDYLGVDIILADDRGPLILELNARPGLAIQTANLRGIKPAVTPRGTLGARFTAIFAWLLLALFAGSPLIADTWWNRRLAAEELSESRSSRTRSEGNGKLMLSDFGTGEGWAEEDRPISETNLLFRQAKESIAKGDTVAALQSYWEAAADSGIAPFVLNNIALIHRRRGEHLQAIDVLSTAIRRFPEYHRAHYNLGLIYRDLDRSREAEACFLTAIEHKPTHSRSWAGLGGIYFLREEYDSAVTAYERAIRFDPDNRSFRLDLGRCLRRQGRFADAAERFREIMQLGSRNAESCYLWARSLLDACDADPRFISPPPDSLARALRERITGRIATSDQRSLLAELDWMSGNPLGAFRAFDRLRKDGHREERSTRASALSARDMGLWQRARFRLRKLAPANGDGARQLAICELGEFMTGGREEGDETPSVPVGADPMLRGILARFAGDSLIVKAMALELRAGGRGREAGILNWLENPGAGESAALSYLESPAARCQIRLSLAARIERADRPPTPLLLWILYREAENSEQPAIAERALAALEESWSPFYPAMRREFLMAQASGDSPEVLRIGAAMRRLVPWDREIVLALAQLEIDRKRSATARKLLEKLNPTARRSAAALTVESRILMAESKPAEAAKLLALAVKTEPESVELRVQLANAQAAAGDLDRACRVLKLALERDPGSIETRQRRARLLMQSRRYTEATFEWKNLVQLQGEERSILFNLALSLQREGSTAAAVNTYSRVLRKDPDYVPAHFNRGLAYETLGRRGQARSAFEHILTLNDEHEASKRKLAEMREDDSDGTQ